MAYIIIFLWLYLFAAMITVCLVHAPVLTTLIILPFALRVFLQGR